MIMRCAKDCASVRYAPRTGRFGDIQRLDNCGLCGRTFYLETMIANSFMEEWLCECCARPASPMRVFAVTLRSLLRQTR